MKILEAILEKINKIFHNLTVKESPKYLFVDIMSRVTLVSKQSTFSMKVNTD